MGGFTPNRGEFPWQISVLKREGANPWVQWCGAALVAPRLVVCAAHCFDPVVPAEIGAKYQFVAGDWNWVDAREGTEQSRRAVNITLHPRFHPELLLNDIAVVYLNEPVLANDYVQPACLPHVSVDRGGGSSGGGAATASASTSTTTSTSTMYQAGALRLISGWGKLREGGPGTRVLQAAYVPLISNEDCIRWHQEQDFDYNENDITENMVCAGFERGGKDACQGDSGGPMVWDEGPVTMVGVISWGVGCGGAKLPGVYTRVANYMGWLNETRREMGDKYGWY